MWVCLCEAVTSGSILDAVDKGAHSVKEVGRINGAGTACGKCALNIRVLIEQRRAGVAPSERGRSWRRALRSSKH